MKFKSTKINPDGSITAEIANGRRITADANGTTTLSIDNLRTAGIRQLAEVESHTVNNVMGAISHHVRFHGGGEVKFAYNQLTGRLIELRAENAAVSISRDGEVLFSRDDANPQATPAIASHWRLKAMKWLIGKLSSR